MKVADVEWSEHSQNGEDGIIDYLLKCAGIEHGTFVEIGCGNGIENNTTRLAKLGWTGVVIDGKRMRIRQYNALGFNVTAHAMYVTPDPNLIDLFPRKPDVFSLDIDSHDWHVMKVLLARKFRPRICVLEYNAAFHLRPLTVPYPVPKGPKDRYYGCGVNAWRRLMEPMGYDFVTVDSRGVNAIFSRGIQHDLEPIEWADCVSLAKAYGPHDERFAQIEHLPLRQA